MLISQSLKTRKSKNKALVGGPVHCDGSLPCYTEWFSQRKRAEPEEKLSDYSFIYIYGHEAQQKGSPLTPYWEIPFQNNGKQGCGHQSVAELQCFPNTFPSTTE